MQGFVYHAVLTRRPIRPIQKYQSSFKEYNQVFTEEINLVKEYKQAYREEVNLVTE